MHEPAIGEPSQLLEAFSPFVRRRAVPTQWLEMHADFLDRFTTHLDHGDQRGDGNELRSCQSLGSEVTSEAAIRRFMLSLVPELELFRHEWYAKLAAEIDVIEWSFDRVRFVAPVKIGDRVCFSSELIDVEALDNDSVRVVQECLIEVRGQEAPACVAELVFKIRPRGCGVAPIWPGHSSQVRLRL